jgi:hypothetical protein
MMPIQKVVSIYKNSMDFQDKGSSRGTLQRTSSSQNSSNRLGQKDKNSFQTILKKTMSK